MSLTKFLGIIGIGLLAFHPLKGNSQDAENEKVYKIFLDEPIPKEKFFTEKYIKYLDNLKYRKLQEDVDIFTFNGIKNFMGVITAPLPLDEVIVMRQNFYLNGPDKEPLYVEFEFFEKSHGITETNYNVTEINKFDNREIGLYLDLGMLVKKRIAKKKGFKETGLWEFIKQAKKHSKDKEYAQARNY